MKRIFKKLFLKERISKDLIMITGIVMAIPSAMALYGGLYSDALFKAGFLCLKIMIVPWILLLILFGISKAIYEENLRKELLEEYKKQGEENALQKGGINGGSGNPSVNNK